MTATVVTPVRVWLPGRDEPTRAGELVNGVGARFVYRADYIQTEGALAVNAPRPRWCTTGSCGW